MPVSRTLLNETLRLRIPYQAPVEARLYDLFENTYDVIDGLATAVNGNPYEQAATFEALPPAADNNAVIYVVQQTTGVIGFRKLAGLYRSDGANWNYLGLYGRNAVEITNVPAGAVASTNVQDAINELDADLTGLSSSLSGKEDAGTASTVLGIHTAAVDPHPQYALEAGLAAVAFSGAYADLTGAPALFDGAYASLTGVPSTFAPTPEAVDDRVAALLVEGANITLTYDDGAGTLTIDAAGGSSGLTASQAMARTLGC